MENIAGVQQQIEQAWENRSLLQEAGIQKTIREVVELLDKGKIRIAESFRFL